MKDNDKEKYVDSRYGITFDGADWWGFGNDFAWNVIIFSVDNSSSSHSGICKNDFLILHKIPLMVLMEALVHQSKCLVLLLLKKTQNFVWGYSIMLIIVICLLIENKSLSLKPTMKMLIFQLNLSREYF